LIAPIFNGFKARQKKMVPGRKATFILIAAAPVFEWTQGTVKAMNVLVTGGAGYIGSHACVELQQQGHGVVIVDSLCNSDASVVERIGRITGTAPVFVQADIRDRPRMAAVQEHADRCRAAPLTLKSVGDRRFLH
jgi:NADPH:quinone reductase-like Zn-dependent oxidoreductase